MIVEPILKLIADAGLAVLNFDLFGHFMPADVKAGVVVLPSLSGNKISYETPKWRSGDAFQIIVRGPSGATALTRAHTVNKAVLILQRTLLASVTADVPNILVSYIRLNSDPVVFPRQLGAQWEVSSNFTAAYAIVS